MSLSGQIKTRQASGRRRTGTAFYGKMPGELLGSNGSSLYQFQDIFCGNSSHFMVFMRQGSDLYGRKLAEIGIIKADNADIFRNPQISIRQFFDEPIGDLIVITDNGSSVF